MLQHGAITGGLSLVGQLPFSHDDLDFLNKYIRARNDKVSTARLYIIISGVLLFGIISLVLFGIAHALGLLVCPLLMITAFYSRRIWLESERRRRLIEADIAQGYLYRYEGDITAEDSIARWVSNCPTNKRRATYLLEILPVSGKVHRVNDALLWTWIHIHSIAKSPSNLRSSV